ncbi:MAG: hypothetical protein KGY99_08455 [Phycisphaerae bacterium]|nr:hypothetical protein [Phycisphaerae bacterium]
MTRRAILATALIASMIAGCGDDAGSSTTRPNRPGYSRDVGSAYVIAHEFCRAWQDGDWPAARERISDKLIQRYGEQRLRDEIVGVAHQKHESFDLKGGAMRGADRAVFTVELVITSRGTHESADESIGPGEMVLIYSDGRWRVDNLPLRTTRVPSD